MVNPVHNILNNQWSSTIKEGTAQQTMQMKSEFRALRKRGLTQAQAIDVYMRTHKNLSPSMADKVKENAGYAYMDLQGLFGL